MSGEEPCEPCKRCGRYQATTFWCTIMRDSECEDLCPLAPDCACEMGFNARMEKSVTTGCAECTCEEQPAVEPGSPASPCASASAASSGEGEGASASSSSEDEDASASSSSEGEGEAGSTSEGSDEGGGEGGSGGCGDDDDDDDDCDEGSRLASRSSRLSMFGRGEAKWIGVYVLAGVATLLTLALLVKYCRNRGKYNGDHIALDHLLAHDTQL